MRHFYVTSDQYCHLIPDAAELFNYYFDRSQEVVVLGYDKVPSNLPNNFKFVSLGKQERSWTNPLLKYFNSIKDNIFHIILDDMFIITKIDLERWKKCEEVMENRLFDKIAVANISEELREGETHGKLMSYNDTFSLLPIGNFYKTALQPAVWRKEWFVKFLKPDFSAWDFELKNRKDACTEDFRVAVLKKKDLFTVYNVYWAGKFNYRLYDKTSKKLNKKVLLLVDKYKDIDYETS